VLVVLHRQLEDQGVSASLSRGLGLKLKAEPRRTEPLEVCLGIFEVSQQSPLDVAAFANIDPLTCVEYTVDPRRIRSMRRTELVDSAKEFPCGNGI
jgi:hypothetical protein